MVDMHAEFFEAGTLEVVTAVGADLEVRVHRPDRVGLVWVDEELEVVLRIAAAVEIVGSAAGWKRARSAPLFPSRPSCRSCPSCLSRPSTSTCGRLHVSDARPARTG